MNRNIKRIVEKEEKKEFYCEKCKKYVKPIIDYIKNPTPEEMEKAIYKWCPKCGYSLK